MTGPEVTAAMKAEDVPAGLVEKAARAIHASQCCPLDKDSQCYGWPINLEEETARHALAAVLPEIQAQAQNGVTEVFEIVDRHTNRRLEERVYLTSNEALNHVSTWDPIDQRIARVQSVARVAATAEETAT